MEPDLGIQFEFDPADIMSCEMILGTLSQEEQPRDFSDHSTSEDSSLTGSERYLNIRFTFLCLSVSYIFSHYVDRTIVGAGSPVNENAFEEVVNGVGVDDSETGQDSQTVPVVSEAT